MHHICAILEKPLEFRAGDATNVLSSLMFVCTRMGINFVPVENDPTLRTLGEEWGISGSETVSTGAAYTRACKLLGLA